MVGRHIVVQFTGLDIDPGIVHRFHIVIGGVAEQVLKHLLALSGVTVLGDVHGAAVIFHKVNHVRVRHGVQHTGPKVRTHGHQGGHQQTAVGAAADGQLAGAGPAIVDHLFGNADEVLITMALGHLHAAFMPGGAVLTAAPEVALDVDTTLFCPAGDLCAADTLHILGQNTVVVTAVSVNQGGGIAVFWGVLVADQIVRNLGAVLGGGGEALFHHQVRMVGIGSRQNRSHLLAVEEQDGRRIGKGLKAQEHAVTSLTGDSYGTIAAGQRHIGVVLQADQAAAHILHSGEEELAVYREAAAQNAVALRQNHGPFLAGDRNDGTVGRGGHGDEIVLAIDGIQVSPVLHLVREHFRITGGGVDGCPVGMGIVLADGRQYIAAVLGGVDLAEDTAGVIFVDHGFLLSGRVKPVENGVALLGLGVGLGGRIIHAAVTCRPAEAEEAVDYGQYLAGGNGINDQRRTGSAGILDHHGQDILILGAGHRMAPHDVTQFLYLG